MGPSGRTWHANIVELNGGLFFENGWSTFVKDNSLELGDSLVFRYNGDSHFSVIVFDQSKVEKEAAFSSECSQGSGYGDDQVKKRDRENPASINSVVGAIPKRTRSSLVYSECISMGTCAQPDKDMVNESGLSEEDVCCLVRQSKKASFSNDEEKTGYKSRNPVTFAVPSQEGITIAYSDVEGEATISNRINEEGFLSAQKAERVARSFASPFPNFTRVMKRFNISGSYTLNIPYQFATAHLPKCKVKIVLHNIRGESWTINSIPTTRVVQTSHTFCGGWLSFVRDNHISLGDFCIFELVRKCELLVHILRVAKEAMEDRSENEMHQVMSTSSCILPQDTSKCKTNNVGGNSPTPLRWSTCGITLKSESPSPDTGSRELVVWEASSLGSLGSYSKGCVSMKSAPEEKLAAQSFLSSFPHFVRIMKKFNVSGSYTLYPAESSVPILDGIPPQLQNRDCSTQPERKALDGKFNHDHQGANIAYLLWWLDGFCSR